MTWIVLKALSGLIAYDLLSPRGKFKTLRRLVARWKTADKKAPPETVGRVTHAVNLACMLYPKQVLCLQRASVTACLLRNQGVRAEMVLGAQKTPFAAHAWVEVDGRAINEKMNVQTRYAVWERC